MHARLEYHHYINLHVGVDSLPVTYLHTDLRHLQFLPIYVIFGPRSEDSQEASG